MASFAMTAATAAAAAALTPSTTFIRAKATDNNNGPRIIPRTKNEDHAAPRCVVSRNGIRVPWQTIHQKYIGSVSNCNGVDGGINKGIKDDIDGDYGDGNFDDDALAMDAVTLLQLLPRGAYTTCRTVRGGTRVYQFDYHVRRLALSAQSILENISGGVNGNVNDWGSHDCNDNVNKSDSAKECGGVESTTVSNHLQQQHDINNPSKDKIYKLNIIDEAWERDMALYCIRSTLDAFRNTYHQINDNNNNSNPGHNNNDGNDDEFRIVLLATWEKKETKCQQQQQQQQPECLLRNNHDIHQSVLYCHVCILPQSSFNNNNNESAAPHNRVLIHGHGRDNALAKDSKWVIERKKLMTPQTPPSKTSNSSSSSSSSSSYEEIILINDNGELLEGTQTNFYVVINSSPGSSAIITTDEGILHGSVRDSVLRVCHTHNVRVELRAPTLNDLRNAKGAFVTSTSRLVMPVHEVVLGDLQYFPHSGDVVDSSNDNGGDCNDRSVPPSSYCYPNCVTTQNIRQWVLDDVETHSTLVYEASD